MDAIDKIESFRPFRRLCDQISVQTIEEYDKSLPQLILELAKGQFNFDAVVRRNSEVKNANMSYTGPTTRSLRFGNFRKLSTKNTTKLENSSDRYDFLTI